MISKFKLVTLINNNFYWKYKKYNLIYIKNNNIYFEKNKW